jgi:hypothetical protein
VDRFTGLLFSSGRTPSVTVEGDQDAEEFLKAVWKKARFWRCMYSARTYGGSMGSALVTVQLRPDQAKKKGRFSYRAHSPKCVQDVVWEDPDLKIPAGVLIQYIYDREIEVLSDEDGSPTGNFKTESYLYRRIIDEEMDVMFRPAKIEGGRLPELEIDEHQTYKHGLGRFPGVWIQNLPNDDDIDGIPDCDGAFQMFETIDRQISQSNKGLLQNQDPTLVIARDKKLEQLGTPLKKGSENALYVGQGGSAQYLEISGSGVNAGMEFAKNQRSNALGKVQMVDVDPEKVSGAAQSAKAIEYIYAPTLEKSGRHREQYGEACETLAEITLELGRMFADPLKYKGNARPRYDLPPKIVEVDMDPDNPDPEVGVTKVMSDHHPGEGGTVVLTWGPYFPPTPMDKQTEIGYLATAYQAGGIDQETFVRKIAPLLEIKDVEGLLRKVREETEQKDKKLEAQMRMSGMFPSEEPAEPPFPGEETLPEESPEF